jgi:drug/metabolite transporter (DMT)-like permease
MLLDHVAIVIWQDLPVLLGLAASATLAQLALTRAYRTGRTLSVASLSYTTIVISSLFGILFWGEHLSIAEWLAIGLIVIGGLLSICSAQSTQ